MSEDDPDSAEPDPIDIEYCSNRDAYTDAKSAFVARITGMALSEYARSRL